MVVVVRHADQRHALREAELPAEKFRHPGHLFEAAAIESRGFGLAHQFQALWKLLENRAGKGPDQRRKIPIGEPGGDIADIAAHAAQRGDHRIDRCSRVFGGVLVSGKSLLLVVEDEARSVRLCNFDEGSTGIVACRAGQGLRDKPSRRAPVFREPARSSCWRNPSRARGNPSWFGLPANVLRETPRRRAGGAAVQFVDSGVNPQAHRKSRSYLCINHRKATVYNAVSFCGISALCEIKPRLASLSPACDTWLNKS